MPAIENRSIIRLSNINLSFESMIAFAIVCNSSYFIMFPYYDVESINNEIKFLVVNSRNRI